MTLRSISFAEPTNYYYFYQQTKAIVYIIIAVVLVWKFPLKILKSHRFATIALVITFILQFCVFIPGIGIELNGARGWIFLP